MENVLHGPEIHLPIPNINLGQRLYNKLKTRNKDDIAFKNEITGEWNSVGKCMEDSSKLAVAITELGISPNTLIAICANNHINYPIVILAALYSGVPLALMNPVYTEYELESLLKTVEPEIIFCSAMNVDVLLATKLKVKSIKRLVVIDELEQNPSNEVFTLSQLLQSNNFDFKIKVVNPKEYLACILFSSGTTGLPKAVTMTHYSINATLIAVDNPSFGIPEINVGLGMLPMFHLYGLYQVLLGLDSSIPIIVMEHFNPIDYLKCVEKYQIMSISVVPPLLHLLAKSPLIDEFDLSHLKDITCGSSPIGEDTLRLAKSRLKLDIIRNVYASTESHHMVALTPPGSNNLKAVGKICAGTSLCIRDLETGRNLPAYQQGEICTKSPMMMKGYYKNESATKETFTEDGWLKSGDVGYFDEEGYLYVVDRIKEFIKYKGYQVPPAELETVLMTNPKIVDVGVIGKPDVKAGESPVAFVVKEEDVSLDEEEVKLYLAKYLSKSKHLHEVYFIDEIPRTRSGKIIRRELKKILGNITNSKL